MFSYLKSKKVVLNQLVVPGKIVKLSKGKFYKPETTVFGNLQPNQAQVIKDLLAENGKINGYLTGYSIYNQPGLTTTGKQYHSDW